MSQNSYLREFCAQVSKIVLLADLTVLQLVRTVWAKISSKLIFPRVLCTSIINHVLSWFDRFTAYYKYHRLYEQKCHVTKLISPRVLIWPFCTSINTHIVLHKCHILCSELIWPFYGTQVIRTVWAKMSQNSYLPVRVLCTSQKIVFSADLKSCSSSSWADLTVLRLITTVWAKISQNSYVQEFCSQVSQVVFLADLTVLGLFTTVWTKIS